MIIHDMRNGREVLTNDLRVLEVTRRIAGVWYSV
jgi:hypothetical protein